MSKVGGDSGGRMLVEELEGAGVDCEWVLAGGPGEQTVSCFIMVTGASRTIVSMPLHLRAADLEAGPPLRDPHVTPPPRPPVPACPCAPTHLGLDNDCDCRCNLVRCDAAGDAGWGRAAAGRATPAHSLGHATPAPLLATSATSALG